MEGPETLAVEAGIDVPSIPASPDVASRSLRPASHREEVSARSIAKRSRVHRRRSRIFLALLSGPLFLGAVELALSLVGWPPPFAGLGVPLTVPYDMFGRGWSDTEIDPETQFRFRRGIPSVGPYPINALGLVGPEAKSDRAPGTVRIACLGDSCTFGIGEVPGRSYPDLLRGMSARAFGEGRVEVLNAGVPTYTSTQSLRRFRRDVAPLRPDVLVAYHGGHNEFQASPMTEAEVAARLSRPEARVLHLSRLARGLRCLLADLHPRPEEARTVRVPLPDFRRDLESLAAECRERGIGLVLVVPPHSPAQRASHPSSVAYAKAVARVASDLGVVAVDLPSSFAAVAPYPLWREAVHPNLAGYRRIALCVYEALVGSPTIEESFRRAGPDLAALRAFEALSARSEREEPAEPEWRAVETGLREAPRSTPELERARGIVEARLGGAVLAERDLRRTGFDSDRAALGLVRFYGGDPGSALELAGAALAAHPYRPGVAALAESLASAGEANGKTAAGPCARGARAESLRGELAVTDPLDLALRSCRSPEDLLRSPARVGAALLLLLHRDRVIGAPATVDPRVGIAGLALERRDTALARALLEAALQANPDETFALSQLALLEDAEGRQGRSRDLFERAVRLDPSYGEAWICLAALALRRGEAESALSCLEACLRARPELSGALVLRARVRIDRGDPGGARKDLIRVREMGAWSPDLEGLWRECGSG